MALDKNQIAKRIAKEVKDGYYVNLGIGIPTLVANFVREDISVEFQSENGVLGMGPFPFEGEEDADIINAGKQTITTLPGASFFDSATSFSISTCRNFRYATCSSRPTCTARSKTRNGSWFTSPRSTSNTAAWSASRR